MPEKKARAPGQLHIDLGAIEKNFRLVQSQAGGSEVAAVLKANAYGLGIKEAHKTLSKWGCDTFFVATLDEGIALRELDSKSRIYALDGLFQNAEFEHIAHRVTPVIGSMETLERWILCTKDLNKPLPAILHFDTGMNRLGFDSDETPAVFEKKEKILDALEVEYIMSHFACAEEPEHELNSKQIELFKKIAAEFPSTPKSFCNSSATFHFTDAQYDMVRPGYCLYGGNPSPGKTNPMKPVVNLTARILQMRNAKKDESVGYGATHQIKTGTKLATVALGYADGFLRSASGKAKLYWNGQPCPIVGRISMDLAIVDLSNLKNSIPAAGEWLEVIGENQSIEQLANDTGTIGYEILTSLGNRYNRIYES